MDNNLEGIIRAKLNTEDANKFILSFEKKSIENLTWVIRESNTLLDNISDNELDKNATIEKIKLYIDAVDAYGWSTIQEKERKEIEKIKDRIQLLHSK